MHTTFEITGYLVGHSWMPNVECYKPLDFAFERHETLRDAVLEATGDGDFRECRIAEGTLHVCRTSWTNTGKRAHHRYFNLSMFPSIADMIKTDWWGPCAEDE